ncbi:uncharacterized protein PAC_03415 [Phialocephala subalpina]|uniref:Uncharacterized protein n=1 Tax=Phialocephala subalpina TaxID=576137 RepID=A0A1L7WL91_9HELO|nr:uncharacterized protein PAC_03415 [Phialocephala subalpina]
MSGCDGQRIARPKKKRIRLIVFWGFLTSLWLLYMVMEKTLSSGLKQKSLSLRGTTSWLACGNAYLVSRIGTVIVAFSYTGWRALGNGFSKRHSFSVIIDHLEDRASQNNNNKVLFFYFDYKQQSEQTPLMIPQTLLSQLPSTFPRLPSAALDLQSNMALGKGLPSWTDLKRVFLDLCNSSARVYVVFDAPDECDKNTNRGQILEFLKELMESPVRTLITSRPYPPDVHKLLSGCSQVLVEASDADVRSYVLEQIGQSDLLAANVIDDELREKITPSIVPKSEGMLLLPALQIENILSQTNKTEVCDALETLPTTLADSLDLTLERIKLQSKHSKTRAKLALSVLMWLSTVRRALTVQELQHAIATKPGLYHLDDLTDPRFFVDCCFGLVVVDQETSIVRLVHFSINEHLQSRKSELFPEADAALAATCLKYLLLTSTSGSAPEVDSVDIQAVCQEWRLIRYAADQWGFHAASRFDANIYEKVVQFCSSRSATKLWILCLEERLAQLGPYKEESWQCVMKQIKPGFSLLHIAAVYGIDKFAEECIKDDSYDVSQTDSQGVTPLRIAAGTGNNRVAEMLISANRNTSVNAADLNWKTALGHAAKEGQTEVVKTLLNSPAQIDVNIGGPLVHACCTIWCLKTEVVDLLLDRPDLDPNPNPLDYDCEPWFGMARSWEPALLAKLLAKPSFDPWRWRSPTKQMRDFWKRVAETDNDPECSGSGLSGVPGFAIVRMLELDERFRFSGLSALQLLWPPLYFANTNHTSEKIEEVDWMTLWTFGWRPTLREFLSANNISLTFVDSKRRGFVHYLALMGFEDYLRFSIR